MPTLQEKLRDPLAKMAEEIYSVMLLQSKTRGTYGAVLMPNEASYPGTFDEQSAEVEKLAARGLETQDVFGPLREAGYACIVFNTVVVDDPS